MAAMAKKLSLTFFLLTLFSTLHARESQFFAKVSNKESQPLSTNQNDPTLTPQTPRDGGAYGLYGHESGQLPPSSTATTTTTTGLPANLPENYNPVAYTTPIHSNTQDLPEEFNDPMTHEYNGESRTYNSQKQDQFVDNGENMYNSEKQVGANGGGMYNSEKQGMSDTRFLENGKYYYSGDDTYNSGKQVVGETRLMGSENGGKMYNNEKRVIGYYNEGNMYNPEKQEMGYNNEGNTYNTEKQGMRYNNGGNMYNTEKLGMRYNNGGNMYNTEKQGLSDTRFLESGKYYYDLNSENSNANGYSRGVRNGYETKGYYGNNDNANSRGVRNGYETKGYYGNNDNSYDRYNSNGGYQNQEEFQENQEDQFNP